MESGHICFGSYGSNSFFVGDGDDYLRGTRMGFTMEEASRKRPFLGSNMDDMLEEEYYDEQLTEKKRRLSPEQVRMLEKSFEEENKLEPERKTELAKMLGLQPRQVAVWFQNRRARWKTKTLERDYNRLKSCYDMLTSDYESVAKENQMLKAEIDSLNDKLQSKKMPKTFIVGQDSNSAIERAGNVPAPLDKVKLEDHLSVPSGGSAVIDDHDGPQLMDSGDSYFPNDDYPGEYGVPVDQSEEDDGSHDGQKYIQYSYSFETRNEPRNEEEDALGWWAW